MEYQQGGCISWRQTGECNPHGPREQENDKSCDEIIPDGHSGFCECHRGERKLLKGCSKGEFESCNAACNGDLSQKGKFKLLNCFH